MTNARPNLATAASLASAPAAPGSVTFRHDTASGGQKFTLRWRAVRRASPYEVLVRTATAATHERVIPVGNVTSYPLDVQLDDASAAVRSVGPTGHRSLATGIATAR